MSRVPDHVGSEWRNEAVWWLLCLHLLHSSKVPVGND